MLRDTIKGLLAMRGLKISDYAAALQLKSGSLSRKLKDESFTYSDLLVLANLTETELCLIDKGTNVSTIKL